MVDQPADAGQHGSLRFERRGVAEQRPRLLDRGVLAAAQVLPARSRRTPAVVPARNSAQLTERVRAVCPNQPAAISRKPRTVSADGATTLNDSPAAASRCSIASWKACATSSAWTWCMQLGAEAGDGDLLAGRERVPDSGIEISQRSDRHPARAADVAGLEHRGDQAAGLGSRRPAARRSPPSAMPYSPNGGEVSSSRIGSLQAQPVAPDRSAVDQVPALAAQSPPPAQPPIRG